MNEYVKDIPTYLSVGIKCYEFIRGKLKVIYPPDYIRNIRDISELIDHLRKATNIKQRELKITGTFFPAVLLYPGWWDRKGGGELKLDLSGCNDVQRWLFEGFQLWGPSWDICLSPENEKPYLLAQLAARDEAESVALIVSRAKAKDIRLNFLKKKEPITVEVTGTLCHRDDVPEHIRYSLGVPGALMDYCIIVREEDQNHKIKHVGTPDFYTGYLWQCWIPKAVAEKKPKYEMPKLNEVYFCWEHTNYATRGALEYNLDSLTRKKEFIQKEMKCGELLLVQKSSLVVPGDDPLCPADEFYQAILGGNTP